MQEDRNSGRSRGGNLVQSRNADISIERNKICVISGLTGLERCPQNPTCWFWSQGDRPECLLKKLAVKTVQFLKAAREGREQERGN